MYASLLLCTLQKKRTGLGNTLAPNRRQVTTSTKYAHTYMCHSAFMGWHTESWGRVHPSRIWCCVQLLAPHHFVIKQGCYCFQTRMIHRIHRIMIPWTKHVLSTTMNFSVCKFQILCITHSSALHKMRYIVILDIVGLVQDCSIYIAGELEILKSCTKPSIW